MAQAQPAPEAEPSLPYTVQKSDKLIRLSRELLAHPRDWNEVARFNRMADPDFITPGQTLRIPLRLMKFQPAAVQVLSVQGSVTGAAGGVKAGDTLAEGARLQAGSDSSAVVALADGSRFKLLPGTAVEIAASRQYATRAAEPWFVGTLRLAQGMLEATAAKGVRRAAPLQVLTPTSAIGVRGTEFRVAFDDPAGRNSRTEVTEGEVRADNTAQRSAAQLPGGTGAVVNPAEREIRVVPLLPAPDLSAAPAEVNKPEGAWPLPAVPGAAAYRVQVAADPAFNQVVRDLKLAAGPAPLGTLDVGTWNVRVRGIDAAGIEGFDSARQVVVRAVLRVTQSSLRLLQGRSELRFGFDRPVAGSIDATLSRDRSLAAPLAQQRLAEPRWDLGTLAPGSYYLQLRVTEPAGTTTTAPMRLEVPPAWGETVFDADFVLTPAR